MNLKEALEGLTEERFCVRFLAVDSKGMPVNEKSCAAVRYCVNGWLFKNNVDIRLRCLSEKCALNLGFLGVASANDSMGYAFVEALRNYSEDTK